MQTMPVKDIQILRDTERGRFKYALFDFDGTVSLLREGWQQVMGPLMVEMICGETKPTPEIEKVCADFIDETTGINTILQMEGLEKLVREYGLVLEDKILDAQGYKAIYNDRLMVRVRERIAQLAAGTLPIEQVTVRGSVEFVKALAARGLQMYIFSGTDRDDVRNESALVGVAPYFAEIWGAMHTYAESNKEMIIKQIIANHDLHGSEVLVVGDGPVEIRLAHEHGCVSVGVCSDELRGHGWSDEKRERLTKAGADILVPDFGENEALMEYLFPN